MLQNLTRYMDYLQKDMAVHTDNVARADLAGEKPRMLKPFSDIVQQRPPQDVRTTHASHLKGSTSQLEAQSVRAQVQNDSYLSGNEIDSEAELQKLNDIGTEYMKANRLYRKASELTKNILNFRS